MWQSHLSTEQKVKGAPHKETMHLIIDNKVILFIQYNKDEIVIHYHLQHDSNFHFGYKNEKLRKKLNVILSLSYVW